MIHKKSLINRWFSKTLPEPALQDSQILNSDQFNRMLCLERKRSHRTGIPFVLLVVDISKLAERGTRKIPDLCIAIQNETRDTDLCGWHSEAEGIGVIYTALQELDLHSVESVISEKIERALRRVLDADEFRLVTMSFHFFPEKSAHQDSSAFKSDEKLYPDLINTGTSRALYGLLKRGIDIGGSLSLLILFMPIFVLIALSIRLSSAGPVFFRQPRVGRFGKEFMCLKFRTMYTGCDSEIHRQYVQKLIEGKENSQKIYKIVNDPRVTPVGRLLRKTSLDELPQFLNVLFGDMSLVGPRPPIPYEIACYRSWHRRRIIESKPGITGLWQVYGRSRTNFDEMVRLDIRYIEEQSFWLDIKLLLRTPWAVINGSGAY